MGRVGPEGRQWSPRSPVSLASIPLCGPAETRAGINRASPPPPRPPFRGLSRPSAPVLVRVVAALSLSPG